MTTMQALNLSAFLALPWSTAQRSAIQDRVSRPEIQALVAWEKAGRLLCSAYNEVPSSYPPASMAVWRRTPSPQTLEPVKSKTMQALDLILRDGMTPHAAAKAMGVHASAVYRALVRAQEKQLCPCCGQVVREGFTVNRDLLKDPSPAPDGA